MLVKLRKPGALRIHTSLTECNPSRKEKDAAAVLEWSRGLVSATVLLGGFDYGAVIVVDSCSCSLCFLITGAMLPDSWCSGRTRREGGGEVGNKGNELEGKAGLRVMGRAASLQVRCVAQLLRTERNIGTVCGRLELQAERAKRSDPNLPHARRPPRCSEGRTGETCRRVPLPSSGWIELLCTFLTRGSATSCCRIVLAEEVCCAQGEGE